MSITKETLKVWRKEALKARKGGYPKDTAVILFEEFCDRILRMTRVLLDLHLLGKR